MPNVAMGLVKSLVLELTERQHIVSLEKPYADLQPFIDFVWGWVILAAGIHPVFI